MTNTNTKIAPREIDVANLDQVVGGASNGGDDIVVHQVRKQEQSDKLTVETEFRPGGPRGSTVIGG